MESTCDITHKDPTHLLSDVGSVLRGRDLEQRERKLLEAQMELLNDRATLEKTNESVNIVNEKNVSYLSEQLADSMGQTVLCQSRIDNLHLQMEELRTNSRIENNHEVTQIKKKLLHANNVSTQKDEEHKNLHTKMKSDLNVYAADMQSQLKEVKSKLHGSVSLVGELTTRLEGSEANVLQLQKNKSSTSKMEVEHQKLYAELQKDVDIYAAKTQKQLADITTKLHVSTTLAGELASKLEGSEAHVHQLQGNNTTTSKMEAEHHKLYSELQKDVDMYTAKTQKKLADVTTKLHISTTLAGELTSKLEGSEASVRLLHDNGTTVSEMEAEHNTLYTELQKDVDNYRANIQAQLQDVTSKLQRSVTLTSELTSKLEGSELKVGDLMEKLADKHTQIVSLSEKLVDSESGYQNIIQEGAIDTAKRIDDQQKISSEQNLKMGEMCKQLETSKNEMEIHRKKMHTDKKRTQSLIETNRLELENARSESNRLADIIDQYQINSSMTADTNDSSESLRIMIRQSLPTDLDPERYNELVDKVMATMGAH